MITLQVVSVLFGLFMLYSVRIHANKQTLTGYEKWIWVGLWILFIAAAMLPQTFQGLVEKLHIARVFDFLVIVAFMILAYVAFQTRVLVRRVERRLETAVRREALHAAKNEK